ncbi:FAM177A1 family protein [Megaselia abdita]
MSATITNDMNNTVENQRRPKKLIHCSDGVIEDSSSDDEVDRTSEYKNDETLAIEKELQWGPYFKYKTLKAGYMILNGVDAAGGALANFFGISTPKYSSEIYFHEKDVKEERRRKEKNHLESANWLPANTNEVVVEDIVTSVKHERF